MKVLALLAVCLFAIGTMAKQNYPPVAPEVTFQAVLALPYDMPDQQLSYGDSPLQQLYLWQAKGSAKGAVFFIHGGCWLNAYDVGHARALATAMRQQGFHVAMPEYRRTGDPGGGWPGSFNDIKGALSHIQSQGPRWFTQAPQVLAGHSAGGHLALLAGGKLANNSRVAGVIGLAAITDMPAYAGGEQRCQQAAVAFMGGTPEQLRSAYQQANPLAAELHPQSVLIHGNQDSIVPVSQAKVSGLKVYWQPEAGHFDMIHPGTPSFSTLISILSEMTE